jgi:magnesium chelatase subunit I
MPLDMQFVFTANPEDYTNRGSIVTPLKDRIGSQILTHYPENINIARTITEQEARLDKRQSELVYVPLLAKDLLEQISFEARDSAYVDAKSGVSARMSITAFENLLSTAERRALMNGEEETVVRLTDFMGIIPSITGKVELVYEGEQEGAAFVAQNLIGSAVKTLFEDYFPKIEKLNHPNAVDPYQEVTDWFFNESGFELTDDGTTETYNAIIDGISPLTNLIEKHQPTSLIEDRRFLKEFILWGLVEHKKLSKERYADGTMFKDLYGNYISKL